MVAHKSISDLCSRTMLNESEILDTKWTCAADGEEQPAVGREKD